MKLPRPFVLQALLVILCLSIAAYSQQAGETLAVPSFEVASIKQNRTADDPMTIHTEPDRFMAMNVTTKFLIEFAYNIQPFQHSEGPGWVSSEKYDIDAKEDDSLGVELQELPGNQRLDQIRLMVQSLLADRFKLKVSHRTMERPVYTLVLAKNGPKFSKADADPSATGFGKGVWETSPGHLIVNDAPFGSFVVWLSRQPEISSLISDQTGLTGDVNFALQWAPSLGQAPDQASAATPLPDASGISIFTALEDQAGLKLEMKMGTIDAIVIDDIERPSPN